MRLIIILAVVLMAITLVVYWQAGDHDFLNYDDNEYVTENQHVTTGLTVPNVIWAFASVDENQAHWHPITWLSHMVDVEFYGMDPRGHHLTNVVIHTISIAFLFLFLFRLTSAPWQSLFVAALFALHPLHVESVAWVSERKDILSALFWFLTLLLYIEYTRQRKWVLYLLSLLFFVLGLMSKAMLVTLPFVMLLLDFWPLNRAIIKEHCNGQYQWFHRLSPLMALVKEKIPFYAFSLVTAVLAVYSQHTGGAIRSFDAVPFVNRIENAAISYVKYIVKMLWPSDLAFFYPIPSSVPLWQTICSLLVLIVVTGAILRVWRSRPYLVVGWFWFLITLVPVIGLVQYGAQSMADRYTYISMTGLFIIAAWGGADLAKWLHCRQGMLVLFAGTVIIVSTTLTWRQLRYWRDDISLFRHALLVTTGNWIAHNNLGNALADRGDLDAAIVEYQSALSIKPNDITAHYNLALAFAGKGDFNAAIPRYREVLKIKPDSIETHINLGDALLKKGNLGLAIHEFREAIRINSNSAEGHNNLGFALAAKGQLDSAIMEYQAALAIKPDYSKAHDNLGNALAKKGYLDAAIQEFQEVLRIKPNSFEAHNNLGFALATKGYLDAALMEFQTALRINSDFLLAKNNLNNVLEQKKRRNK